MKNQAEALTINNVEKNVEEWVLSSSKGLLTSIYQKRITEAKQGG